MPGNVEKAGFAARMSDGARDVARRRGVVEQRRDVNDRDIARYVAHDTTG
jgi:hypothetical protein